MDVYLEISRREWQVVDRVADAINASDFTSSIRLERQTECPEFQAGFGHWEIAGDSMTVSIIHQADWPGDLEVGVPLQIVRHAASLTERAETCSFVVSDDGYQYLKSPTEAGAVVDSVPVPTSSRCGFHVLASARVRAEDLLKVAESAMYIVGELDGQPAPSVTIAVEDGQVGICTDWRPFGKPKATFRAAAWEVIGSAAAGAMPVSLPRLLRMATVPDTVVLVEIGEEGVRFHSNPYLDGEIGEIGGDSENFTGDDLADWFRQLRSSLGGGDSWSAFVPVRPVGALRWIDTVVRAIDEAGHHWSRLRPGLIGVQRATVEAPQVSIEFCDTEVEILRLTRQIPLGEHVTEEQGHRAVSRLTATQTEARFWLEQDVIVAGYDLPCVRWREVATRVDWLLEKTEGLDVLVALDSWT
jgi:hypothetical protein